MLNTRRNLLIFSLPQLFYRRLESAEAGKPRSPRFEHCESRSTITGEHSSAGSSAPKLIKQAACGRLSNLCREPADWGEHSSKTGKVKWEKAKNVKKFWNFKKVLLLRVFNKFHTLELTHWFNRRPCTASVWRARNARSASVNILANRAVSRSPQSDTHAHRSLIHGGQRRLHSFFVWKTFRCFRTPALTAGEPPAVRAASALA